MCTKQSVAQPQNTKSQSAFVGSWKPSAEVSFRFDEFFEADRRVRDDRGGGAGRVLPGDVGLVLRGRSAVARRNPDLHTGRPLEPVRAAPLLSAGHLSLFLGGGPAVRRLTRALPLGQ